MADHGSARSTTVRRDTYDVVIVGSGIGGLTAAALLARSGLTVLVAEAQSAPGGYVHAFERGPYVFDPSVHLVVDPPMFGRLLGYLGVRDRVTFLQPESFFTVELPDFRLHAPFGLERFVEAHAACFPNQVSQIRRFFEVCARVQAEAHELPARLSLGTLDQATEQFPTLFKYRRATVSQVLDEYLDDPRAKVVCAAAAQYLGLSSSKLSFQTFAQMIISHVVNGANYVEGGLQRLVDAFVEAVEQRGGEVVVSNRVSRIVVEGGHVDGVILENGHRVQAQSVISNADPIRTYEQLVGLELLPPRFDRTYRRLQVSGSAFVIFAVTAVDMRKLDAGHLSFTGATWDLESLADASLRGKPDQLVIAIPTLVDPTLAPAGEHEVSLVWVVPYDIGRPWGEVKPIMTEGCLARADELYPGFRQHLTFKESATPVTLERFSLNHGGALYGWENTPEQTGSRRPNQVAPIDGLFLAGHWTGPGGGFVRALGTGVVAAQLVLKRAGSSLEIPRFMS